MGPQVWWETGWVGLNRDREAVAMAKMFYSLEEAAQRLGKSEAEVEEMAESGQLSIFRDRDKLMFKVEQVDLLSEGDAGDTGADEIIPLADAGDSGGLSLEDSGAVDLGATAGATQAAKEASGISIFDADDLEVADAAAQTQITSTGGADFGVGASPGGSGSGLLDLTREADDTSLGADLLEDVYSDDDVVGAGAGGGGALFESTSAVSDVSGAGAAPAAVVAHEVYDGGGSGFVGGIALGITLVTAFVIATLVIGFVGVPTNALLDMATSQQAMIFAAILAGVVFVPGLIGWAIMRGKS